MKKEKFPTLDEISQINTQRALSDAEKIGEGAKYKGNMLEFTSQQIKAAEKEMEAEKNLADKEQSLRAQLEKAMTQENFALVAQISEQLAEMQKNKSKIGRYGSPEPKVNQSGKSLEDFHGSREEGGRSRSGEGGRSTKAAEKKSSGEGGRSGSYRRSG